jgi:hypothetical protein
MALGLVRRRFRTLLIGRMLGGDPRRWALYLGSLTALRVLQKYVRGEPELIYDAKLPPGHRVEVLTQEPAPARARSRRRRKALEAEVRSELGS